LVYVAIGCALLSSLLYAAASVLQHRAAIAQPQERSMRIGLLARLVTKPLWLAGIAADGLAFVFQFIALGHGSLILVQPLLVSGLLFALPLGAWLAGTRLTHRDWAGAAALVVGLSLFLLVASPDPGHATVADRTWLLLGVIVVASVGGLLVLARGGPSRRRAAMLAAAAGIVYGMTAALTKSVAHLLGIGVSHVLTSWQVEALIVAGVLGMLLAQSAFQAGPLDASLPSLTVTDPIVSIAIGAFALGEGIETNPVASVLEAVGLILVVIGVVALGKSQARIEAREQSSPRASARPGPGRTQRQGDGRGRVGGGLDAGIGPSPRPGE
jgi:drug/metabolite transporter (DMT)-like permease